VRLDGARLRTEIDLAFPALRHAASGFWTAPGLRERYPRYLSELHGAVRATTSLLDTALTESRRRPHDPVARRLVSYLAEQRRAEDGHDTWLLEDYAAVGGDVAKLLEAAPGPEVAALVGAQYYWILHVHPVALLGHIAVLEQHPPAAGIADRLAGQTGLPAPAFRTLAAHAELDLGHGATLDALLDAVPLTPGQRALVGTSALHSVARLVAMFTRLAGPISTTTR
jgi:hypothetical protein